jgi:hypothetical protein
LIKTVTPEEQELAEKKAELDRLSKHLADKELDLEEIRLAVARFQHRYFAEIGKKYVRLDDLRAQIAELRARHSPHDAGLKRVADVAREAAARSSAEYQNDQNVSEATVEKPESSDDVKKLYRNIAMVIHPDKATDEKSRHFRTRLMAELNEAYARQDVARMRAILMEWEQSPDAVPGVETAAELVRAIRAIAQIKRRITEIERAISEIIASEIHQLMTSVHQADLVSRNILAEMGASLDSQIEHAIEELELLKR